MKFKIIILLLVIASGCKAQSFFKPLPKPGYTSGKFSLAGNPADSVMNSIRPLVGVSATILNDGTALAGGLGLGFQHNKWNQLSQTWVTQYSVSALLFIDSKGEAIPSVLLGFANGLLQIGPGYNLGTKQFTLLTGVGIKFN